MDKKRKETIVLALCTIAILLIVCFVVTDHRTMTAQERYLDAEELHYDADGYFILIDRETAQMGYYNASTPIYHLHGDRVRPEFMEGVYRTYKADNGLYFFYDSCGIPAYRFVLTLTDAELEYFKDMPERIPALVR